jgi:hypothetical protein
MKIRKSLFVVSAVGLWFVGFYVSERGTQGAVSGPQLVADGGDPMPVPKPTRGTAIVADEAAASVLVADGGDPMPRPPHGLA